MRTNLDNFGNMKRIKLQIDHEYDFSLIGIIASVKFYKIAWAINNQLIIRLIKQEDYVIETKDGKKAAFGNYSYDLEHSSFQLFKNKSVDGEKAYLLPELIHFDYVFKIDSDSQSFSNEVIVKELKEVKWIEYIAALEIETLKSKDNFLS